MPFWRNDSVISGDFQQILLIINEDSSWSEIINSFIKRSYLGQHFKLLHLRNNTRLQIQNDGLSTKCKLKVFNKWILEMGDGISSMQNDDTLTRIPENFILSPTVNDL